MLNTFTRFFKYSFLFILIICILFIPLLNLNAVNNTSSISVLYSDLGFIWPIPGYTDISSYFGRRNSPTAGASSYHSGIDIPAPEGTNIYAIDDAVVTFCSWGAGGGYTITLHLIKHPDIKVSYCHVSPVMYVVRNETVLKGKVVGSVGPLNVYGINDNPYRDEYGNPTNGASTGCHLHFTIKENDEPVNPLDYYK